ncbi:hypothetical protein LCGC14_2842070 [marine sediment metagenome]|uniref:Uncharacterized protein n=1 Tax=marine sediment metagenome TaxID=412755 RepID=A0A0F8YB33_9ZZZZ
MERAPGPGPDAPEAPYEPPALSQNPIMQMLSQWLFSGNGLPQPQVILTLRIAATLLLRVLCVLCGKTHPITQPPSSANSPNDWLKRLSEIMNFSCGTPACSAAKARRPSSSIARVTSWTWPGSGS